VEKQNKKSSPQRNQEHTKSHKAEQLKVVKSNVITSEISLLVGAFSFLSSLCVSLCDLGFFVVRTFLRVIVNSAILQPTTISGAARPVTLVASALQYWDDSRLSGIEPIA
jgi:hypothetical protein